MLVFLFILLLVTLGVLAVPQAKGNVWRFSFEVLCAGFILSSLVLVVLLEVSSFTLSGIFGGMAALALLMALGRYYRDGGISISLPKPSISLPFAFALIVVSAAHVYFRAPVSNYAAGGQDQGVYVNMGNHYARTGQAFYQDPLPELLAGNEALAAFYEKHSRSGLRKREHIPFAREVLPGLYFHHEDPEHFVPQFYHLHPLLLGLSNLLLGPSHTTAILVPISVLALLSLIFLARDLSRSDGVGLLAGALYATNPAVSYFVTFPVSETTASFFFLSACYFLSRGRGVVFPYLMLATAGFTAFFLTRISGFMLLCFLLAAVSVRLLSAARKRQRALTAFGVLLILAFGWSFIHGLLFSFPYARHIYYENLKIRGDIWSAGSLFLLGIAISFALVSFFRRRFAPIAGRLAVFLRQYRLQIALGILAMIVGAIVFRGYQLGYTDAFASHPYFGKRWRLAGGGWDSLYRVNGIAFFHILSPAVAVFFLFGFYLVIRRTFSSTICAVFTTTIVGLLSFYTLRNFVAGNYYYYTRYLTSELVPLGIILSCLGASYVCRRWPPVYRSIFLSLFLLAGVLPSSSRALGHVGETDMDGFYASLKQLDDTLPEKAIVVLDRRGMPYEVIALPLLLTFGRPTMIYRIDELLRAAHMPERFSWIESQGYEVILLSAQTGWRKFPFLKQFHKAVVPMKRLQLTNGSVFPSWERSKQGPSLRLHAYAFEPDSGIETK